MGAFDLLYQGLLNPQKAIKKIRKREFRHKLYRIFNQSYHSRLGRRQYNPKGIDIFNEDWHNLVILDAMRLDSMQAGIRRAGLDWDVESRISRGSQTPEWLRANFHQKELHDVVYVTASPMLHNLTTRPRTTRRKERYGFSVQFYNQINVWSNPPNDLEIEYTGNENDVVIPAEVMAQVTLDVAENYPDKRLLIHFVQPHTPYWGSTGEKLHDITPSPWKSKLSGELERPVSELRQAYKENVDLALEAAELLVNNLDGKTVVSSDHGEYLYERSFPLPHREILHPDRIYTDTLVKIPWVEFSGNKTIRPENPITTNKNIHQNKPNEQLEALGYM